MFKKEFVAGWAEMDFNMHMGNAAYLNKAADTRLMFFSEHGFPGHEFKRLQIGPVARKDELEYFKEINLLDRFSVSFILAGLAEDGSRMSLRNEFFVDETRLAARVSSLAGWVDMQKRKLVVPPPRLLSALNKLARAEDFVVLPSSVKP